MKLTPEKTGESTYCPEDDKLRLYVGRVPRAEYDALRAEGWTSTPKQSCDFVATWTPSREDTALAYGGGYIGDEDQDPADRAADRAERFAGYLGKRLTEATAHADTYEDGPTVHGYQDPTRAERAAARHDREADKAGTQWGKAEYWQRRTAGVIAHALYKADPGVRMGRIKTLEAELRKHEKGSRDYHAEAQHKFDVVQSVIEHAEGKREKMLAGAGMPWSVRNIRSADGTPEGEPTTPEQMRRAALASVLDTLRGDQRDRIAYDGAKQGTRPAADIAREWLEGRTRPADWDRTRSRWAMHYDLRIAYEMQMLGEQGGRLETEGVQVGGKICGMLILKTNKSTATGRVTSVSLLGESKTPGTLWAEYFRSTERMNPADYTPPTEASLAELARIKKEIAAAKKQSTPKAPPLLSLTPEDAEKLLAVWNTPAEAASRARYGLKPLEVKHLTQAQYSAHSKGSYGSAETKEITGGGHIRRGSGHSSFSDFPAVAKVRTFSGCPVVITDKPQKPLAGYIWEDPRPAARAEVLERFAELQAACGCHWTSDMTPEQAELFEMARRVGLAYKSSQSQFGLTEEGLEIARTMNAAAV